MPNINATLNITNNSKAIKDEVAHAILRGFKAIGEKAETYAKKDCPVDTGRLRNSITYVVSDGFQAGANNSGGEPAKEADYKPHGRPDENTLVLGTNVVYAPPQEFCETFNHTSGKAHFLRDAISTHGDEYRKTMEASLKAAE